MPEVRGFRALRYNRDVVGAFDNVVTPPFDVISPEERQTLMAKSPHNWCHVILPEERNGKDKYASAGAYVRAWRESGALRMDGEDSLYLLEQEFRGLDGVSRKRRGFFAVARIPEPGDRSVLGHERTFAKKVTDRLALTGATRVNQGAVFALYDDSERDLATFFAQAQGRQPDLEAHTIDDVTQRMWKVPNTPALTTFFKNKTLYIADGHHRYRTACEYRDRCRAERRTDANTMPVPRYEYVMMGFIELSDPGLVVYPAHRVVELGESFDLHKFIESLRPWFDVQPAKGQLITEVQNTASKQHRAGACVIGFSAGTNKQFLLILKDIDRVAFLGDDHGPAWRDLDVAVLHRGILERVLGLHADAELMYEVDDKKVQALVASGSNRLAFILNHIRPQQVCACADSGEFMPQKATYFFPKLPSGVVMHALD